jgi:SAM-dependent methyltransferase
MLPIGWSKAFSKSNNREYYVHESSGRRQWHEPDPIIEKDREKIHSFYSSLDHKSERSSQKWRAFNNFLKQAVMKEFIYDLCCDYMNEFKYSVLDVGCGSGGDLGKWERLGARSYLGFDFCKSSITQLQERAATFKSMKIASFIGDFTTGEAWDRLPEGKFDVVSCQFAAHYAFAEKQSARSFFSGLSRTLSRRGRAIIITVDSDWRQSKKSTWGPAHISRCSKESVAFGDKYEFSLENRVTAPEWWVHKDAFASESLYAGLEIGFEANLASFAAFLGVSSPRVLDSRLIAWKYDHEPSFEAMCKNEVGAEEWAISSLYKIYIVHRKDVIVAKALQRDFLKWNEETYMR